MAINFYQNNVNSNVIILNPREVYLQPFEIQNWNEIRASFYLNVIATGSNYTGIPVANETLTINSSPNSCAFIGFCKSDANYPFPFVSGNFIGAGTSTGSVNSVYADEYIRDGTYGIVYALNNNIYNGSLSIGNGYLIRVGYSAPDFFNNTYVLKIKNKGNTGQSFSFARAQAASATISLTETGARTNASNLNALSSFATGYWTTGFASNGGPLDLPDSFMFYAPFFQVRLKIGELLVEKYA